IAHKPKLIFFDEPTVAVDPQSRNKILEGIVELNKAGATIVYTSHYMEEVEQICSRILIMDKGHSVAFGTREELKHMIKNTETISIDLPEIAGEHLQALREKEHAYEVTFSENRLVMKFSGGNHNLVEVLDYMRKNDLRFGGVYSEQPTLNDVFLEITGTELRD
ncbi:MAG: DUF4162 domain-containing protein, partial [Clostridiales bacterium]|nr:DUF4162 domain-containing protein [Candidatus Blautia equi]